MRVAIFFDGKNFYSGWRDKAGHRKIDFKKLSEWVVRRVRGTHLWGVNYYTGVEVSNGVESESQRSLSGFLEMLERQPGFFVQRFPRKVHRSTCASCGTETRFTQEKELDTTMVADMLRLAAVGAYDILVLVSGDADYAPAIEGVRSLGKQAYVATWGGTGLSNRIRRVAFDHLDLLEGVARFSTPLAESDREPVVTPEGEGIRRVVRDREPDFEPDEYDDEPEGDDEFLASDEDELRDEEPEEDAEEGAEAVAGNRRQHATFLDELERATLKFEGSYVGLSYFVTRWRSNALDSSPESRRRLLDELIRAGRVEVYDAQDGSKAIRMIEVVR